MRRTLLITTLVLAALPIASANAAAVHHQSAVTLHFGGSYFDGIVDSSAAPCVKSRTVKVLYRSTAPPAFAATSLAYIGEDVTDRHGNWKVTPASVQTGIYRAKATRKVYERNGSRHVCDPARSDVIDLE